MKIIKYIAFIILFSITKLYIEEPRKNHYIDCEDDELLWGFCFRPRKIPTIIYGLLIDTPINLVWHGIGGVIEYWRCLDLDYTRDYSSYELISRTKPSTYDFYTLY